MATDIAKLAIEISATGAKTVTQELKGVEAQSNKTEDATESLIRKIDKKVKTLQLDKTATEQAARATESMNVVTNKIDADAEKYRQELNKIYEEMRKTVGATESMTSATTQAAEATKRAQKASQEAWFNQRKHNESLAQSKAGITGVSGAMYENTQASKKMANNVRLASMQLSQVAQQGAITGNYLSALAIQLPDLALGLGTVGILAGAAVGAIAMTAMGMQDAANSSDMLSEALERLDAVTEKNDGIVTLTDEIRELAKVSEIAAQGRLVSAMAAAEEAAKAAGKGIAEAFDSLGADYGFSAISDFIKPEYLVMSDGYVEIITELGEALGYTGDKAYDAGGGILDLIRRANQMPTAENFTALENAISEISTTTAKTNPEVQALVYRLSEYFDGARTAAERSKALQDALNGVGDSALHASESVDKIVKGLEEEYLKLSLSERALLMHNLAAAGASDLSRERALALFDEVDALKEKTKAEKEAITELERFRTKMQNLLESADPFEKIAQTVAEANKAFSLGIYDEAERLSVIDKAFESLGTATNYAAKEQEEFNKRIQSMIDNTDPLEKLTRTIADVNRAISEGKMSNAQGDMAISKAFEDAFGKPEELGKETSERFVNPWLSAAEGVGKSLQDAIAAGDWDSLGMGVGNAFAASMSAIVSKTLTDSLAAGITSNSSVLAQIGGAFAGPIAGAVVGGVIQLAMKEISDYFSDDVDIAAERQATQGTGTVLGSIDAKSESIKRAVEGSESGIGQLVGINQAMLASLRAVQSGIVGAATMIAKGAAGITPSGPTPMTGAEVISPLMSDALFGGFGLLGGKFKEIADKASEAYLDFLSVWLTAGLVDFGKLLGGKSKLKDQGIRIIGGTLDDLMTDTIVQAYASYRMKKHALDDYDTYNSFQALDDDISRQFGLVFVSLYESVSSAADILGVNVEDSLRDFVIQTQMISLHGLSAERQQEELQAYFSTVFDGMAEAAIPFLEEFQMAGEGLGETLSRVANSVAVTREIVDRLGLTFSELSGRELIEASERLAEMSGGLESLITNMQGFTDNFATDAQKFSLAQSDVQRALGQLGLSLPSTRAGYYALVKAQDASTSAGARNVARLLELQGVADNYYEFLEDSASEYAESLKSTFTAISEALNRLYSTADDFVERTRQNSLTFLREALRTGNVSYTDALANAIDSVSTINMDQFATFADYARETAVTGALLSQIQMAAGQQLGVEEMTLEAIMDGNLDIVSALSQINQTLGGAPVTVANPVSLSVPNSASNASTLEALLRENIEVNKATARNTHASAKTLERFELDGIELREDI